MVCHEILSAGFPIPAGAERVTLHETFPVTPNAPHHAARFVATQLTELPSEISTAATGLIEQLISTAGERIDAPLTVSVTRSPSTALIALLGGHDAIPAITAPEVLRTGEGAVFVVAAFGAGGKAMWFTVPLP